MLTPLKPEVSQMENPSHEARRFRTVLQTFERNAELLFRDTHYEPQIDHAALAEAFSAWRQAFDRSRHLADIDRKDFIIYAAGLMAKELVTAAPLKVTLKDGTAPKVPANDIDKRIERWPEGYAYASFCISLASAILQKDSGTEVKTVPAADDPKFWQSFRENTLESPANAVAFFDLICGQTPNWSFPDIPYLREAFQQPLKALEAEAKRKLDRS